MIAVLQYVTIPLFLVKVLLVYVCSLKSHMGTFCLEFHLLLLCPHLISLTQTNDTSMTECNGFALLRAQ